MFVSVFSGRKVQYMKDKKGRVLVNEANWTSGLLTCEREELTKANASNEHIVPTTLHPNYIKTVLQ
jgi:hypothetical protein